MRTPISFQIVISGLLRASGLFLIVNQPIGANRKSMSRRGEKCLLARGKSYLQTVNSPGGLTREGTLVPGAYREETYCM